MEQNQQEEMNEPQEQAPEDAGRGTDTVLAHLSLGEIVIPRAFQDDPNFMQILQSAFQQAGVDIGQYTVGDKANKINPETGYPEFGFLSHIFKSPIFKIAAPLALSFLAPGLGTALGSGLLGAGAAGAETLGSSLIGGGLGALTGGGLKGGLLGALGGGIGANIGSFGDLQPSGEYSSGTGIAGAIGDNVPGVNSLANAVSSGFSGVKDALGGASDSVSSSLGLSSPNVGSALQGSSTFDPSNLASNSTNIGSFLSGNSGAPLTNLTSLGGLSGGGSGGGSTFGNFNTGGSIASALGGLGQNAAIKKAQQQLLASNAAQQANLGTFDPSNITNDAGYQFNLQQGQQGLDRSAAAGGDLFSGKALKAASQYNQNYANNALQSAYQRWLDKTGAQNQLTGNQGAINAGGTVAGANALTTGLSGALNPTSGLSSQDLLKLLGKQQGGLYG